MRNLEAKPKPKVWSVYTLIHPETNEVIWVGSSCSVSSRISGLKKEHLINFGYNPVSKIIATHTDIIEAKKHESELISFHKEVGSPIRNVRDGFTGSVPKSERGRVKQYKNLVSIYNYQEKRILINANKSL